MLRAAGTAGPDVEGTDLPSHPPARLLCTAGLCGGEWAGARWDWVGLLSWILALRLPCCLFLAVVEWPGWHWALVALWLWIGDFVESLLLHISYCDTYALPVPFGHSVVHPGCITYCYDAGLQVLSCPPLTCGAYSETAAGKGFLLPPLRTSGPDISSAVDPTPGGAG